MKKLTLSDYQALAEFRYQIRRFLHFSDGFLVSTERREIAIRVIEMTLSIAGIQGEAAQIFSFSRGPVEFKVCHDEAERRVRPREPH